MYKIFVVTIRKIPETERNVSVTNVDIFEKKTFSPQFFYSLLQVYIVYRLSFIFHLSFADRGEENRTGMYAEIFVHEFYNFLLFNF